MPLHKLSLRNSSESSPAIQSQNDAKHSVHPPKSPTSIASTNLLLSPTSSESDERKINLFRKIFSSSSIAPSLSPISSSDPEFNEQSSKKIRSSLVPLNYTPLFPVWQQERILLPSHQQWAHKIIAYTSDNGIRSLLNDLYSILTDMERRPLMLSIDDIDLFYSWFEAFHTILQQLFHLDEQCLYAWIEGTDLLTSEQRKWDDPPDKLDAELSQGRRQRRTGEILRMMNVILTYKHKFSGKPILQTLPLLSKSVQPMIEHLVNHLNLKSQKLPSIIYSRLKQKDITRFEKDYWTNAFRIQDSEFTIIASICWMSPRMIRYWKRKYCPKAKKNSIRDWEHTFKTEFQAIVVEFNERVQAAELERENQMRFSQMIRERAVETYGGNMAECVGNYDDDIDTENFCSDDNVETE